MRSVRVLVHLNNLALGGAQLNAVDIARTLRDRGHDPVLFAQGVDGPAPLVEVAAGHGLDVVVAGGPDTPHSEVRRRLGGWPPSTAASCCTPGRSERPATPTSGPAVTAGSRW